VKGARAPLGFVALLCCLGTLGGAASGCGGAEPTDDDGSSALIAFLSGKGPEVLEGDEPARYGALLVRHAVRAGGYLRAGVPEPGADGWSPIVVESDGGLRPADVTAWLAAGDIDSTGRFTPCSKPCPATARLAPPTHDRELTNMDERVARAAGAVRRLVGRDVEIAWAPVSERAIVLTADGRVQVNSRLLQLVVPDAPVGAITPQPSGETGSFGTPAKAGESGGIAAGEPSPKNVPVLAEVDGGISETSPRPREAPDLGLTGWGAGNIMKGCDSPCKKCSFGPTGPSGTGPGLFFSLTTLAAIVARRRRCAASRIGEMT